MGVAAALASACSDPGVVVGGGGVDASAAGPEPGETGASTTTRGSEAGDATSSGSGSDPGETSGTSSGQAEPPPLQRPNILLVLTDDQRADTLACMPKLQAALGDHGIVFDRMYASTPLCCPSRSTILTGKYAHNHGVRTNDDAEDPDGGGTLGGADVFRDNGNEEDVVARHLKEVGYTTGFFGKYMNGYERHSPHVPPHWDRWYAKLDGDFYDFVMVQKRPGAGKERVCYRGPGNSGSANAADRCERDADRTVKHGENHSDEVQTELAIAFMRDSVAAGSPFFAHLSLKAPHGPAIAPRRYQPDADRFQWSDAALERLQACPLWAWDDRPPSWFEEDLSDKPQWVKKDPAKRDDTDAFRRHQLASLLHVDDAMQEIVATLESLGVLDETVIVFTSDNGYMWGEHGREKKNCAYEECARLPMVVRHPYAAAGSVASAFVQTADLFPTFLALAGAEIPDDVDGTSFAGLLDGSDPAWPRDAVFVECWPKGHIFAAVRTDDWKLVEYYEDVAQTQPLLRPDGTPERELYDMQEDPFELDNLLLLSASQLAATGWSADELEAIVAELDDRLGEFQAQ